MSFTTTTAPVPANRGVPGRAGYVEAPKDSRRSERAAGKGRQRRAAAEQRRIEQQRWGQYLDDNDDADVSVVAPNPANNRRRARRSSRRNLARDDLEEYLNGTVDADLRPPLTAQHDEVELDVALALSLSLTDSATIAQNARSQAPAITDMTYESLVQLENVRCVASTALVTSLTVCHFSKEQPASADQASEVCAICQGEYEDGEALIMLPCQHKFHQACGAEWLLKYSKLCPVCKHDVTEEASGPASPV